MKKALEIIWNNNSVYGFIDGEKTAQEIHEHYLKFVEWKDAHCDPVEAIDFKGYYHVDWLFYPNNEAITLDEVYQYYCDKILNSKK